MHYSVGLGNGQIEAEGFATSQPFGYVLCRWKFKPSLMLCHV
jgi:hypothetical protein